LRYKHKHYENKAWLTLKLIHTANKFNWLNALATFVQLRSIHTKGIFYNYSIRSLSRQLNCSPTTLSKHIKKLADNGLISVNNGNLCLTGRDKLLKRYPSAEFPVQVSPKRKEQQAYIKFTILNSNLHKQEKIYKLKKDIIKIHQSKKSDPKKTKKLLKLEKTLTLNNSSLETSLSKDFILSNRNIGAMFYRSQATGLRFQKQLNKLKLIRSERNSIIVEPFPISYREFRERYISNKYQHSKKTGLVFKCLPNIIKVVGSRIPEKMNNVVSHKMDSNIAINNPLKTA